MTLPTNKGFHPILEQDHPYTFIDTCMQAWPDADYANAHRHGCTAYGVTAWMPHDSIEQALESVMNWHLIARQQPNLGVAFTAEDIRRAKRDGKSVFVLAAQGGDWIGFKLHRIEAMYRLGLRFMLLAYNRTNHLADGCLDSTDRGLTNYGKLVVDECNRLGLVLDCTHTGKRSTLDIIDRSSAPCIFSHSSCRALVDTARNIDDEQIRACVGQGGVIGVASWGPAILKADKSTWPTVDEFIDHVDHVAQLVGDANHIGIGTDMSLGTYIHLKVDPWGEPAYTDVLSRYHALINPDVRSPKRALDGFHCYPQVVNFADRLERRGYSTTDIANILGGNYLRLFDQVWR